MKWYTKLLVFLSIATLAFVIGGMTYVVRAKYSMNEYSVQLGTAFNAATMVNATQTHTQPDEAVIASYNGQQSVIVPENYKALQSYLRRDHAMPLFGWVDREQALHVSICAQSHLYITGDRDGQGALIRFESAGEKFLMHVRGGDLWEKIVKICLEGTSKYPNLPL